MRGISSESKPQGGRTQIDQLLWNTASAASRELTARVLEPQPRGPTHPHVGTSYKQQQSPTSGSPARITRRIQSASDRTSASPQPGLYFGQDGSFSSSACSASPPSVTRPGQGGRWPPGGAVPPPQPQQQQDRGCQPGQSGSEHGSHSSRRGRPSVVGLHRAQVNLMPSYSSAPLTE